MSNYDLNFNKLIYYIIHPAMVVSNVFDLLKCLVYPITEIKNSFDNFRKEITYKLKITSQVVYLERALNDSFDYDQRRIYISNIDKQVVTYLYDREDWDQLSEDEKTYLYDREDNNPGELFDRATFGTGGFAVIVPFVLTDKQRIRINSILNYYKLPGKTYIIVETT